MRRAEILVHSDLVFEHKCPYFYINVLPYKASTEFCGIVFAGDFRGKRGYEIYFFDSSSYFAKIRSKVLSVATRDII